MWICPKCNTYNSGDTCSSCNYVYQHSKIIDPDPAEEVILQTKGPKKKLKNGKKKGRSFSDKMTGDVIIAVKPVVKKMNKRTKVIITVGIIYFVAMAIVIVYQLFFKPPEHGKINHKTSVSESIGVGEPNSNAETQPPQTQTPETETTTAPPAETTPQQTPAAQTPAATQTPATQTPTTQTPTVQAPAAQPSAVPQKVTIGITSYGEVTQENADQYQIPRGVMIKEVAPDSPAAKAGLKFGDVIVKYNKTRVLYGDDIQLLKEGTVGTKAVLTIFRTGKGEFNVTIVY